MAASAVHADVEEAESTIDRDFRYLRGDLLYKACMYTSIYSLSGRRPGGCHDLGADRLDLPPPDLDELDLSPLGLDVLELFALGLDALELPAFFAKPPINHLAYHVAAF